MATSGSTDFNLNRNQLIISALRVINVIGEGETPTAQQISDASQALNMMVKAWQAEGIGLWLNQEVTLFLELNEYRYSLGSTGDHCSSATVETALSADASSGDGSITVSAITGISDGDYVGIELDDGTLQWDTVNGTPSGSTITLDGTLDDDATDGAAVYTYTTKITRPLEVLEARLVNGLNERSLYIIGMNEYENLPDKRGTGSALHVRYQPTLTNGTLEVWPACSDVTEQIKMTVKLPIEDFDSITDNAHFPVEWLRALKFNLAVEVSPEYGKIPSQTVMSLATESKERVRLFDFEDVPLKIYPDYRR